MNLKLLWYCTKAKDRHDYLSADCGYSVGVDYGESLNGKIVAVSDFDCEEIIHTYENKDTTYHHYNTKTLDNEQLLRKSHIIGQGLNDYLCDHDYDKNNNTVGYAIHIKNLEIFDKPKKLREFEKVGSYNNPTIKCKGKERGRCNHGISPFTGKLVGCEKARLTKAPQNMCYVQDIFGNKYVLISVRPEWLCLILNGLKDVELRRKVLKEML